MAVTSIWPIHGRVDKVIDYVRNPEKTTEAGLPELASLHAVEDVVEYAADEMKTERRSYVSCLNCREDTAAAQFMETKRLWASRGAGYATTGISPSKRMRSRRKPPMRSASGWRRSCGAGVLKL